jgi:hypothetical protein
MAVTVFVRDGVGLLQHRSGACSTAVRQLSRVVALVFEFLLAPFCRKRLGVGIMRHMCISLRV